MASKKNVGGKVSGAKTSGAKREPLCEDIAGKGCGLKKVIDIVGGKWKIMILCVIDNKEVVRYGELNRAVDGITNTMLANSLKELEADGLVERKQYDEMPVRVEYNLTKKAKSLIPILLELKKWGEVNL
ncbi:transcriptional regulator [Butyrivibrio sp. CB08]|uniref:winged helix-turn-helix transcriptional regulator n=1 Tax=Butyrivibrio sp. CB08 TaxID=2364879 RepID=UPI000EA8E161|nr:helix-turn-helix domain-containing protein [Butyrivibrio sp. CB08]RKM60660.1 transcriptional regulator [Butyrivibrio sp. CB08]